MCFLEEMIWLSYWEVRVFQSFMVLVSEEVFLVSRGFRVSGVSGVFRFSGVLGFVEFDGFRALGF